MTFLKEVQHLIGLTLHNGGGEVSPLAQRKQAPALVSVRGALTTLRSTYLWPP